MIGLEREVGHRPAGFRTHILVSLGSCLMMIVSFTAVSKMSPGELWRIDPMRLAANVITGVGFLGAGAIIRMGANVRGLTTAATLWATCGIGLAVGGGLYGESFFTVVLLLATLVFLQKVERAWKLKQDIHFLRIVLSEGNSVQAIYHALEQKVQKIRRLECLSREKHIEVSASVIAPSEVMKELFALLLKQDHVIKVEGQ